MRTGEGGFAAPLVIAAVALISLSVLVAAHVAGDQRGRLRRGMDDATLQIAAASAAARVTFLLLTEPMGRDGPVIGGDRTAVREGAIDVLPNRQPVMALDARPYLVTAPNGAELLVSAQDGAGLVNLNSADDAVLARLAALTGASPSQAARLGDALADFVDTDDLTRTNGAERAAYARIGAAARNAPLTHASGVDAAYGWADAPLRRDALFASAAALPEGQPFNVNTAPAIALRAVLGLDSRAAMYVIDARAERTFQSPDELIARTGVNLDGGGAGVWTAPARLVRLTARRAEDWNSAATAQEVWISLAPDHASRPYIRRWRVPVRVPAMERNDGAALPASSQLLAARER